MEHGTIPVILDTDIGTDVDDIVALGLVLRAPRFDLRAVTTVYGDTALRARLARGVLAVAGRAEVPVSSGVERPLMGRDPIFWEGWEADGIPPYDESTVPPAPHAVDLLLEQVLEQPGTVTILAIGPLTNIAVAMLREPRFAGAVKRIVCMAGMFQRRLDQFMFPYVEHNIRCDPEAAQVVLASGAPITLVPLDVTTRARVRRDDLERLAVDPLGRVLAEHLDRYMRHKGRDWTHPHDALACAVVPYPELVTIVTMHVEVETRGELTRGQTPAVLARHEQPDRAVADVAVQVEAEAFENWLIAMLAGENVSEAPEIAAGAAQAR